MIRRKNKERIEILVCRDVLWALLIRKHYQMNFSHIYFLKFWLQVINNSSSNPLTRKFGQF